MLLWQYLSFTYIFTRNIFDFGFLREKILVICKSLGVVCFSCLWWKLECSLIEKYFSQPSNSVIGSFASLLFVEWAGWESPRMERVTPRSAARVGQKGGAEAAINRPRSASVSRLARSPVRDLKICPIHCLCLGRTCNHSRGATEKRKYFS